MSFLRTVGTPNYFQTLRDGREVKKKKKKKEITGIASRSLLYWKRLSVFVYTSQQHNEASQGRMVGENEDAWVQNNLSFQQAHKERS